MVSGGDAGARELLHLSYSGTGNPAPRGGEGNTLLGPRCVCVSVCRADEHNAQASKLLRRDGSEIISRTALLKTTLISAKILFLTCVSINAVSELSLQLFFDSTSSLPQD